MTNELENQFIGVAAIVLAHLYGMWRRNAYRAARYQYVRRNWRERCPQCRKRMTRRKDHPRSLTVDHIIPIWVCRRYDLPQLEFDPRNFAILCSTCNSERGCIETTWDSLTLPPSVKAMILTKHEEWLKLKSMQSGLPIRALTT